jgi:hypothetical protein
MVSTTATCTGVILLKRDKAVPYKVGAFGPRAGSVDRVTRDPNRRADTARSGSVRRSSPGTFGVGLGEGNPRPVCPASRL